jgi:hypothetical protein
MIWIIIIAAIILLLVWGYSSGKNTEEKQNSFESSLKDQGVDTNTRINLGTYIGGHPNIDKSITHMFCYKDKLALKLYAKLYKTPGVISSVYFDYLASIPTNAIRNISIEDNTSIEQKVTAGRIFLVGIYALAWKKTIKNKKAFLNIQWSDGRFDHETIFVFENGGALGQANQARNALMKQVR